MKRLDRYVLKELTVPFLMGSVVIGLLFIANEFIAVFKNFELSHVPFVAVFQLVMFKFPHWLSFTLPTGMALASALALSRLARESEVTAMRAAGVSVKRILLPVALAGALVAVGNFLVVEKVAPPAARAYQRLLQEFIFFSSAPKFQSNVMRKLDRYTVSIGTVERGVPGQVLLTDIVAMERPRTGEVWIYTADSGVYQDGVWRMRRPYLRMLRGLDMFAAYPSKDLVINEPIRVSELFTPPQPDQETIGDLARAIRRNAEAHQDTTQLQVALHVKYSLPFSCLVFALTGALLAIWLSKAGPFVGVLLSLGLVIFYYNAQVISTEILGRNGWAPPVLAAWLPNLIVLAIGFLVMRRTE